MSRRIVLFGATGYTGRLTAQVLADSGTPAVLAGRDAGRLTALAEASPIAVAATSLPGMRGLLTAVQDRMIRSANREPDAGAGLRAHVVAVARDEGGEPLAEVRLTGIEPYDFTARMLAWAAGRFVAEGVPGAGAYGPVGAFGIEALESACAAAGLSVAED